MANIIWEGNRKEFGTSHQSPPVSKNAIKILDSEGIIGKSLPFGILPMLIGFIVALPLHEFAHAICYPKGATVWVGLCLRKVAAYAISYHPLTKKRFIIMSLAPAVLGIIPLIGFILIPITMKPLLTICMVLAYMGLISPAPDYMGIVSVLMKAPPYALICDTQDGLYAYVKRAK